MQSILTQILQSEDFIEKVKDHVIDNVIGMKGKGHDSLDGTIDGEVDAYSVMSDPVFNILNGDSLEWSIDFKLQGDATICYVNSDGNDGESQVSGLCEGCINVTFPDDTLRIEKIEDILVAIRLEVDIYSVSLEVND